jgi:hypothetical protein
MALDFPAFGDALWKVYDQTGIRPEWQTPVIALETGGTFDPAITNPGGCVGLNQFCPGTYSHYVHVPVAEYRTWLASQQLAGPVLAYWKDAIAFDKIRSSTRLMVAQLGQALLRTPASLDRVVFRTPSIEYRSNSGFDTQKNGAITEQDIANAMARQAASAKVKDAIAKAYAMRPDEVMRDPVYGDDYSGGGGITAPARGGRLAPVLFVGALLATAAVVVWKR